MRLPRTHQPGRRRGRGGAAAAELAILLPVLVFTCLATVDFARVFNACVALENCARAGALYACDPNSATQSQYANVTAAALAEAGSLSPAPNVTVGYSATAGGTYSANGTKNYVQVTVTWTFDTLISYPGIPSSVSLTRSVSMEMLPSS
jgi:Flp pilus assembly protein TadG